MAEFQTSSVKIPEVFDGQTQVTQLILECISEGIVVADLEGRILLFNDAARSFLGAGSEDVPLAAWPKTYGLFPSDRITPFPHDQFPLAQAVRGETVPTVEIFVRNSGIPDGALLGVSAQPWRDGAGELRGASVAPPEPLRSPHAGPSRDSRTRRPRASPGWPRRSARPS